VITHRWWSGAASLTLGLVVLAAPTSAAAAGSRPPTSLSPALGSLLATLPGGATTPVLITLRERTDLTSLPAPANRAGRLSAVVRRLRSDTSRSQTSLRARLRSLAAQGEVTDVTPLWVTNAVAVTATAAAVRELAGRPDVESIRPDPMTLRTMSAPPEPNITAVGAPELWSTNQTGQGVVVATLDSGADLANPDLAGRWRGGTNSWYDPYGEHPDGPVDLTGHGTATLGAMVGGDDAGTAYGMAPGATWIAARVFDDRGAASATAIHEAFQWLLDPDGDPSTADAPQIVNSSWVIGTGPSCDLAFQADVQALRAAGIMPVFAAGNFGPYAATSASPANYPESISVGAVDAAGVVWAYSGAGPTGCAGRTRVFPDLVAPGVGVLAADRYDGYTHLSGTSVAAPHVSGALALLAGAHPLASPDAFERALTTSAVDLGALGPDDRYGFGLVDVAAADAALAVPPDLKLDVAPGELTAGAGATLTLTVGATPMGGFDAATDLSLGGLPSDAARWDFAPASVAPGAWTSTLTVVLGSGIPDGSYVLTVSASGGGVTRAASARLTVLTPADFSMAASPELVTVRRGHHGTVTLAVRPTGGFSGNVTVEVGPLPAGVAMARTTRKVAVPKDVTWRLSVSRRAAPGTYAVTLTGAGGGRTHSVTVSVVVV